MSQDNTEPAMDRAEDKIPTLYQFSCPQCKKRRLFRKNGHLVSTEKVEKELPSGEKISFFKDICDICIAKLYQKYFAPKKGDAKKVLSALEDNRTLGDKSLEELV
jgi:hypothetical protein